MSAPRAAADIDVALTVNGERVVRRVEARRHLIDFLRLDLGLMGSHVGCEHGVCGACTVRVDGMIVRGCLVLAASLDGARVETIEGVSDAGEIRDLQEAFVARNACQCGYCTPAMLLTAADLLARNPQPTREEIREHISGNYCRCTGYHAIVDAVAMVAHARATGATRSPPPGGEGLGLGGTPTSDVPPSPPPQRSPTRGERGSPRNARAGS
jgi:carbon-monoxide dehydrogenase small subunit